MALNTSYMGLSLRTPLVASSSGKTATAKHIEKLASAGIGAVVMKSAFEEQLVREAEDLWAGGAQGPEAYDYLAGYVKSHRVEEHLQELRAARKACDVPLIASINCLAHGGDWVSFAKEFVQAGADALELNIFLFPGDVLKTGGEYEERYVDTVARVVREVKVPVSVKLPRNLTHVVNMLKRLEQAGAKAGVLYNRFPSVDIDLKNFTLVRGNLFSREGDLLPSLRWVSLAHALLPKMEVGVSTGVHSGADVAKALLVGAQIVQVCSVLYTEGESVIGKMNQELESIMARGKYANVEAMRGALGYGKGENPALYERMQFMRYFSSHEE